MKVKVCGMREHENIKEVASLMPGYLGFIFYPGSPRFVGDHFQMPEIDKSIKKVGVFVNATTESILAKGVVNELDVLQLHGAESVEQCEELRSHNMLIIKAFSVSNEFNFQHVKPYQEVVDYFLFDTKGKYFGGNATRFDWSVLKKYNQQTPFFLSGGLKPEYIEEVKALSDMNIYAIDVNSGVETSPGVKDVTKVRAIIEGINQG
jgi:phosphoribosylanthranilate isomerase